jgi:K+-transporting ATPase KdpF subunit
LFVSDRLLGFHQSLRQAVGEKQMDYVIAGIAALGLLVYLVYALLRPEKF